MYYEKEFVRRDETGNFVFSRLHRTERTTELFKVLRAERDLWARLTALHFGIRQRSFTPRQYKMVIDILGKPEETDDDFREWPYDSNRNM